MPRREAVRSEWQGLGFQIGGMRLVAPIADVGELMKVPRLARVPVVKPWMRGIANNRGRLVPIVDLHIYLGIEPVLPVNQWRVLLVEHQQMTVGLIVEQSLGIQHFLEDSFEAGSNENLGALTPHIKGTFRHGGRVFYHVRLKTIFEDANFLDVELTQG
ncbi:MAG: chemotaxis protein CheW [Proteobacteria bacterium]|nr:chemotaxis protein CheW [Pseudomonadota bacterium]